MESLREWVVTDVLSVTGAGGGSECNSEVFIPLINEPLKPTTGTTFWVTNLASVANLFIIEAGSSSVARNCVFPECE
jgi:hypothetical protein